MPYLSHILGKRVVDSVGQPMGRIVDLAITVEEPFGGDFPPVTLVLVRAGSANLRLRWEMIADLNAMGRGNACLLDLPRARLTIGQEKEGELYLRRDVLDKQILDMSNYRLVRVNDIFLLEDGDQLRAAGVDVSFRGLLRRIHLEDVVAPIVKRLGSSMQRGYIPWNQVEVMRTEEGGKIQLKVPTDKLSRLHPTDLANIVHQMNPVERTELIEKLDVETAAYTLEEVDDEVAADIVESLDSEHAADIIDEMDPDEVADVLSEVESEQTKEEILSRMDDPEEAADIRHLLSYEEGTAGALMTTDVVTVRREMTTDEALQKLRAEQPEPESLHYLYVADDEGKLVGVVGLAELVIAPPETRLGDILRDELITVEPETDAEECARLIAKYDLLSLPVVDLHGQLLGVVTVDDVLDVIAPEEWKAKIPRVFASRQTA
ncbi:MAG: CBS domain-containing protein [Armatimonadota bacterium]|nr:CBS domain-containing protein [Armatimonadota bacterium]